ncbi:Trans-2-enoyl-CoA reductase, mitochondrial [Galdieria sulphuraria]|uniref:Oxidoreductase, zinc-binding dehydrogenase family protein n=1 Tax=Galdieria sulphuraria TaxID=130081 RepID=M2XIV5_GALSU|nr:oxidoreductase, zinc-binding dehydrogenase family protein [Galdieria sulphuraria]EME30032.1 oxidoreductase, zinc-binding dehydrogenase family protein [Galdieria sulphuraria]GJD06246.1 Trans-2-enoyl-CoA reductase, mitochondrial [Galdieria sulphuraria]|eukprot:XP_005706552.1 oxidoreductase, zinc-binding dehydrogenase family protein [Galdieria sulphuraria]
MNDERVSPIPCLQTRLELVHFGKPQEEGVLRLRRDAPVPVPHGSQVLVKMLYAPLHPADMFTIVGFYPGVRYVIEKQAGFVPGLEGCGVVVAQGEDATIPLGMRVVPLLGEEAGSWQQYVCVEGRQCICVPNDINDTTAAQLLVNPLTVVGLLKEVERLVDLYENPWILQTAANSTLGRMTIALAKHHSVKTINVIRSSETMEELKQLGADVVIVEEQDGQWDRTVYQVTKGKGVAAVLEAVGSEMGSLAFNCLQSGGLYLAYGAQSGKPIRMSNSDLIFKDIICKGFWLSRWFPKQPPHVVEDLFDLFRKRVFEPRIQTILPLDRYLEAFRLQREKNRRGKILFSLQMD